MKPLSWLDARNPGAPFPNPQNALREPNGLLAVGGGLEPQRLLNAYRSGIFPWFDAGQPILWWSPDPRTIFLPDHIHVSHSLRKRLRGAHYRSSFDHAFAEVIDACAAPRPNAPSSWITAQMRDAYCTLHALGYAHSVETWYDDTLIGGLYGVALGGVFFGESMFSRRSDASKVALVQLAGLLLRRGFGFIDCQMETDHLLSLGAQTISRDHFLSLLRAQVTRPLPVDSWRHEPPMVFR
ncbi:leucyl/phenylalanyl-tRNA--protein transferase [Plasticicumulans acidivorans]|uniref:Leucyl/phenylalanyl-tRNA--protein transferase n=1 Tax=Plasticicumulans acidivorans TaxID=886464 RepID=A0A317N1F4_9GAMM|nr:leucyl/phenylalanyl-tRNA--protein transferase [Plasticicumulans acidivorans]PWV65748.1 leucyl/phenylalanyl-tRNA--protein transferase [Plasticicumulans acidivorans]